MDANEVYKGERLDQYVISQLPDLSRAFAVRLIEQGSVLINDKPALKAGYKLRPQDTVTINYTEDAKQHIPDIDLPVVYEDEDCVVISKPLGLLTHSKGAFNPEATVATWLRAHMLKLGVDVGSDQRAGIVHRLDRATSGVMICAKTPEALAWLQKQFSQRKVKKTYMAVVSGVMTEPHAIIDMPIERNPKKPQTFRVGSNGKSAITEYTVVETNGTVSLLELKPTTGRTHQLRVHLLQIEHPIVGDTFYGGKPADRLYLHAEKLELTLPSKRREVFEVAAPPEFQEFFGE